MILLAHIKYTYKKGALERGAYTLVEAENIEEARKKSEDYIKEKYPDMIIVKIDVGETIK